MKKIKGSGCYHDKKHQQIKNSGGTFVKKKEQLPAHSTASGISKKKR